MAAQRNTDIDAVRGFNRFYTRRIGVLRRGYLDSEFSLTEVRILYEIAHGGGVTASQIAAGLDLDAGYLSRTLHRLEKRGLIARTSNRKDGRSSHLRLTAAGRRTFRPLDQRSASMAGAMLEPLPASERARVIDSMRAIEAIVSGGTKAPRRVTLRTHRAGDLGWIVYRHGVVYAREYGWGAEFESLVAGIAAKFLRDFDAERERCWIAELDGSPAGSVMVVNAGKRVAQLRLLLVEPEARGLGLGDRLVNECIAFARAAGYRKMILWTQSNLDAARRVYRKAGFALSKEERHSGFGKGLVGQGWRLAL